MAGGDKRINWLLILQGWAMLWVVIGHAPLGEPCAGPLWETVLYRFAYSFHMPLFMLVSGWLFYRTRLADSWKRMGEGRTLNGWNSPERTSAKAVSNTSAPVDDTAGATASPRSWTYGAVLRDKALRILVPGLFFSLVALALKVAFPGEMERQVSLSAGAILHTYLYPYDNALRELWFLVTLFWMFALTPLWRVVLRRPWSQWLVLALLAGLWFFPLRTGLLCLDKVCSHAIWFYLGMVVSKEDIAARYLAPRVWLPLLAGTAIYLLGLYLEYLAGICAGAGAAVSASGVVESLSPDGLSAGVASTGFASGLSAGVASSWLAAGIASGWAPVCLSVGTLLAILGGVLFSFGIALLADRFVPRIFFSFRDYTYQIFLMGIFAQIFVKILNRHALASFPYALVWLLCVLAGLYLPVLVARLAERISFRPLSLCLGLRVKRSR